MGRVESGVMIAVTLAALSAPKLAEADMFSMDPMDIALDPTNVFNPNGIWADSGPTQAQLEYQVKAAQEQMEAIQAVYSTLVQAGIPLKGDLSTESFRARYAAYEARFENMQALDLEAEHDAEFIEGLRTLGDDLAKEVDSLAIFHDYPEIKPTLIEGFRQFMEENPDDVEEIERLDAALTAADNAYESGDIAALRTAIREASDIPVRINWQVPLMIVGGTFLAGAGVAVFVTRRQ